MLRRDTGIEVVWTVVLERDWVTPVERLTGDEARGDVADGHYRRTGYQRDADYERDTPCQPHGRSLFPARQDCRTDVDPTNADASRGFAMVRRGEGRKNCMLTVLP